MAKMSTVEKKLKDKIAIERMLAGEEDEYLANKPKTSVQSKLFE